MFIKSSVLVFLTLFLFVPVLAQKKVTDKDFRGLRGSVKSVINESATIEEINGEIKEKARGLESEYDFDKDGSLTQILYPTANRKLVYSLIDGYKTYKSSEIKQGVKTGLPTVAMPSTKADKPDERYDAMYVYEYDSQGNIKEEKEYSNGGQLDKETVYQYDKKGRIKQADSSERYSSFQHIYKYDDAGNVIEDNTVQTVKSSGAKSESSTKYVDYKIDAQGNWIQRTMIWSFTEMGRLNVRKYNNYRKVAYYEK